MHSFIDSLEAKNNKMSSKSFEMLRDFSNAGSFHGVPKIFFNRNFYHRLIWVITVAFAYIIFSFYFIQTLNLHIFEKPVKTDIKYFTKENINFPDVIICPVLPNSTALENEFPPDTKRTYGFLSTLVENPIYSAFRSDLARNISVAFDKYPNVEQNWKNLFKLDQTPDYVASHLSKFFKSRQIRAENQKTEPA